MRASEPPSAAVSPAGQMIYSYRAPGATPWPRRASPLPTAAMASSPARCTDRCCRRGADTRGERMHRGRADKDRQVKFDQPCDGIAQPLRVLGRQQVKGRPPDRITAGGAQACRQGGARLLRARHQNQRLFFPAFQDLASAPRRLRPVGAPGPLHHWIIEPWNHRALASSNQGNHRTPAPLHPCTLATLHHRTIEPSTHNLPRCPRRDSSAAGNRRSTPSAQAARPLAGRPLRPAPPASASARASRRFARCRPRPAGAADRPRCARRPRAETRSCHPGRAIPPARR